ncbi:protein of unknown function DUF2431 [Nostoc flagelliforme CCNUN1]|uniref:25S rRNA (uridine-N(3))-methyltransferase BMT5-like domain-containing protein n=1 Tax=Nostoc flagelliforme CCNUN1 TaxID=2038116 RepID=A0A2K8T584_9NOSO|nr:Rossmann-like fold-containing protein [Nostoc flagelliforme]AUB42185.1 protein of unknown function DUF2431 [Nostoc flagelliforme CCNUN1]
MDREEESRKRKQRPSPGSDSGEEAPRPRQRTDRQDVSGSLSRLNISNIPAQQPAQEQEMHPAPSASGVVERSSGQRVKRRLYVGEGDFSGSLAMTKKHPDEAEGIHATSYEPSDDELFKEGSAAAKNKQQLLERGAKVSHGIDATNLGKYHQEGGKLGTEKFDKAYFHHPRSSNRNGPSAKKLSHDFAASARDVLTENGKIHLSLPSSGTYEKGEKKTPQQIRNNLYGAKPVKDIEKLGYKLDEKRAGIIDRYGESGFSHTKTGKGEGLSNLKSREFVFRRKNSNESVDSNPDEYTDIDTGSGTESTGSKEKSEEIEQQSENEEMEQQSKSEGKKRAL